jgi:hypothetical protein
MKTASGLKKVLFSSGLLLLLILAPAGQQKLFSVNEAQAAPSPCVAGSVIATRGDPNNINNYTFDPFLGAPANAQYACLTSRPAGGGDTQSIEYNVNQFYDQNNQVISGATAINNALGTQQCVGGACVPVDDGASWFQTHVWFPLMTWLGSWFLTIGGFLVYVAGGLFDILVQHVIIGFGQTLKDLGISGAISTGWTVFRDVANIVIIGMFVFIALCTILSIQQYGAKKLAARVIIVAVLLNFSLLFTEMIIDFSNFTAFQFYSAMPATNGVAAGDIAGAFLKPMGITSIWNTRSIVQNAGQASGGSGFAAFLYGLIGGLMLAGIAFVLAYGCFQIAARAVAIIFLMVTASVAFASYLVPQFSDGNYGWKAWWHELLNASIFAPLLMIFLFIALTILNAAKTLIPANGASQDAFGLGGLVSGTGAGSGATSAAFSATWQAIFTYLIVMGLLYVSIKVSSKLASSAGTGIVSGAMNLASTVATGGVGLLSGSVIAPIARQTIGARFYQRQQDKSSQAKEAATQAGDAMRSYATFKDVSPELAAQAKRTAEEQQRIAARRGKQAAFAGKVADSKMNIMDTSRAKKITKRLKVTGVFSGQSGKGTVGYATAAKNAGDAGAKVAESIKPDLEKIRVAAETQKLDANKLAFEQKKDAAKRARDQAESEKETRNTAQKQQKEMEEKRNDALIATAKNNSVGKPEDHATVQNQAIATELRKAFQEELKNVSDPVKRDSLEKDIQTKSMHDPESMKDLHKEIVEAISDPTAREKSDAKLQQTEHDRASTLRQEGEKISNARNRIVQAAMANDAVKADSQVVAAQEKLTDANVNLNRTDKQFTEKNTLATNLEKEAKELGDNLERGVKEAGTKAQAAVNAAMPEIAAEAVLQQRSLWKRMLGVETTFDERAADKARGAFKTRESGKRAKEAINDYLEERERQEKASTEVSSGGAAKTT